MRAISGIHQYRRNNSAARLKLNIQHFKIHHNEILLLLAAR